MKTLLLTFSFTLAFFALLAQQNSGSQLKDQPILQFVNEEGMLMNDSTIEFNSTDPFGDIVQPYKIKSTASDTLYIQVRKITHQLVNNAMSTFCLNYCFPPTVDTSEVLALPPGEVQFFELYYNSNGNSGLTHASFEVFDLATLGSKVSAQIHAKYIVSPNSIDEAPALFISNAYPNPATTRTTFSHSIPDRSANTNVIFRNMLGQQVLVSKLNASYDRTSIDLSSLKSGMYTYSVLINGKTYNSGKLVVK